LDPLEITALARIVDELDYYQILEIQPGATRAEIKKAYYRGSRSFHPDSNRSIDGDLRTQCEQISKRITEAYCVLRDPRRRKAYDDHRDSEGGVRMQLADARAQHRRAESEERGGKTAQGRQFYQRAVQDRDSGNAKGAIQNLQMALTFEPGNQGFKDMIEEIKDAD